MAKSRSLTKKCFYCDQIFAVSRSAIGDHFPIPNRYGGELAVPCCHTCHSLKDRIPLKEWPVELLAAVINDFPNMKRETRIFMAKTIALMCDALAMTAESTDGSQSLMETGDQSQYVESLLEKSLEVYRVSQSQRIEDQQVC